MPVPADVSAAYRTLAEVFERMRPYRSGEGPLDGMIELLVENSQAPPKEVKGVSQGFLDGEFETLFSGRLGSCAVLALLLKEALRGFLMRE